MFSWLKSKIREWLLSEDKSLPPSYDMEVMVCGSVMKMKAESVMGLAIICTDDYNERLVMIDDVKDRKHWRRVWDHLGGVLPHWSDGTPYNLS